MKAIVQYSELAGLPSTGGSVLIKPIDHPNERLNGKWVRTSEIQEVGSTSQGPVFETLNSIYIPWHENVRLTAHMVRDSEVEA